jgi:hypothetical protein
VRLEGRRFSIPDRSGHLLRHARRHPRRRKALVADYEAGQRVGELAGVYGIHRTTVSAHAASR